MIDWRSIFDKAHPVAGASADEIKRFVATVNQPLSLVEIEEINQGQRNPFHEGDRLYEAWRAFDPVQWVLPTGPLSPSYLEFLHWSNGGEFQTGERVIQFFPALDPGHGVRAMLLAYHLPQYMPQALPFAFDGCGTFYLFDQRAAPRNGEFPVVCAHSGNLGWEREACTRVATSFLKVCKGDRREGSTSIH